MPVNRSPVRENPPSTPSTTTVAHLQQFAFQNNAIQSPKRSKRGNEEISDDGDEIILNMNDENSALNLLKSIFKTVTNLSKDMSEIKNQLNTHMQSCNSENMATLNITVQNLQKQLELVKSLPSNSSTKISKEQYEENKRKRKDITDWEAQHFKRRDAFYASYRAEQEKSHLEEFINGDPVYIPKKYRPKPILGEPEIRYKIRERRSIANIMAEIELRNDTISSNKEAYTSIDLEMINKIDLISSEERKSELKELWKSETEAAEERGKNYWSEKKEHWWNNIRNNEPYTGYQSDMEVEEAGENQNSENQSTNGNQRNQAQEQTYSRVTRNDNNHRSEQNPAGVQATRNAPDFNNRNNRRGYNNQNQRQPNYNSNQNKTRGPRSDSNTRRPQQRGRANSRSNNENTTRTPRRGGQYNSRTRSESNARTPSGNTGTSNSNNRHFLGGTGRWYQPR